MERDYLASQAMGVLTQADRKNDATLRLAIGQISYDHGNLKGAESELLMARGVVSPEDLRVIASIEEMLGLLYQRLGEQEKAIAHFEASVAAEPRRQLPLRRLAEIYGAMEDWVNGARWMEEYVRTEPLALGHQYGTLGDYYLAGRDVPNALKALQTGLELDPYTFWARFRMGRMFEEQQQIPEAIQNYEIAAHYGFDRSPEIYTRLAGIYKREGRIDDAMDLIQTGRRIYPTNLEIDRLYRELHGDQVIIN
jgi:tetratricopeptide (TPR) repeat protein